MVLLAAETLTKKQATARIDIHIELPGADAAIRERAEPGAVVQLCQVAPESLSSVDALSPRASKAALGLWRLGVTPG